MPGSVRSRVAPVVWRLQCSGRALLQRFAARDRAALWMERYSDTGQRRVAHVECSGKWREQRGQLQEAWLEREVAVLNEGGAGFIAVSPQTFGIRRFGISVNALRDVERVRVDISNGKQTKQVAIRITDSGALDELTGKMIPEGVLWFSTTSSPSVTAVVVEGPDRSKRNLSNIAMMNESWTQSDGGTVLLVE